MSNDHPVSHRVRVRVLGEAAVATGWRRNAAERIARPVAGSAPVTGDKVRAIVGLVFLAASGSYVVKALSAARRPDAGPPTRHASRGWQRSMAVSLAAADQGWRKSVADRATPALTARTSLDETQARALLGAGFLALSGYYVAGSVRRAARMER